MFCDKGCPKSCEESVDSVRAYSECWLIDDGLRLKTCRGLSTDCSLAVFDAVDDLGIVWVPSPRELVDDKAGSLLKVRTTGALSP